MDVHLVQIADNLPLDRLEEAELESLRRRAREANVALEVGTRGIAAEQLSTYLGLAVRFGSPIVRTVLDTAQWQPSPDDVVSVLGEVVPHFERSGVNLAIENHDRFKGKVLLGIINRIASDRVGVCLDTSNSFGCGEGPESVLELLGPRVINLHVKDFCVRRLGPSQGFVIEGRPAGEGQLDIPHLLDRLRQLGRDPSAILEQWPPPEKVVEQTIAKEARWAQAGVKYLRQFIQT